MDAERAGLAAEAGDLACTSGSFSACCSSALSRSTIGRGVPPVTNRPYQVLISTPWMPDSASVGTFGSSAARFGS